MFADAMEDLDISIAVKKQVDHRRNAEQDPQADISLYVPWGIMGSEDYKKAGKSEKPD